MNAAFPPNKSNYPHRSAPGSLQKFIMAIAVITLLAACGKVKEQAIPAGSVVLALGDSLTAGAGVTQAEAWPNLLASRSGWVVINGGVSGDTSGEALRRLPALLVSPLIPLLITIHPAWLDSRLGHASSGATPAPAVRLSPSASTLLPGGRASSLILVQAMGRSRVMMNNRWGALTAHRRKPARCALMGEMPTFMSR